MYWRCYWQRAARANDHDASYHRPCLWPPDPSTAHPPKLPQAPQRPVSGGSCTCRRCSRPLPGAPLRETPQTLRGTLLVPRWQSPRAPWRLQVRGDLRKVSPATLGRACRPPCDGPPAQGSPHSGAPAGAGAHAACLNARARPSRLLGAPVRPPPGTPGARHCWPTPPRLVGAQAGGERRRVPVEGALGCFERPWAGHGFPNPSPKSVRSPAGEMPGGNHRSVQEPSPGAPGPALVLVLGPVRAMPWSCLHRPCWLCPARGACAVSACCPPPRPLPWPHPIARQEEAVRLGAPPQCLPPPPGRPAPSCSARAPAGSAQARAG